jgi:hypothetical protein
MRKALGLLLLSFAVTYGFSTACWAATIRVNTPKVILSLAPGSTNSDEITFENPTDEELRVKIYLEDWNYLNGSTGEKKFAPAGTMPLSAAKWIDFSPAETVLAPFSRGTERYTIHVPQDASGSHFAVLFFETVLGVQKDEEGANVLVSGRVGSLFFLEAEGTAQRKGVVRSVAVEPPSGNSPMSVTTDFKNEGNTDITVSGNFLLMNADSQVVGRGELTKIFTFPGDQATVKTDWAGRLSPGQYQLVLTYDLGKGQAIVEEKSFSVAA